MGIYITSRVSSETGCTSVTSERVWVGLMFLLCFTHSPVKEQ